MNRLFISRFSAPFAELSLIHDGAALWELHFSRREANDFREEVPLPAFLMKPLQAYFAGEIDALRSIPLHLVGTDFQKQVWEGLRTIPGGQAWSYAELAAAIGSPKACRAVGMANGRNPCALVVPCHRVIAADGTLGGFSSGLDNKRWLLRHEGVNWR